MKTWMKVLIVTLVVGLPTLPLGQVIWSAPPGSAQPSGAELPFFIFLSLIESLLFGLGVAFLLFGYPLVRRVARGPKAISWVAFISVAWLLVSWWPHDNFHRVTPEGNFVNLLFIEYGFHLTLMAAGAVLAYYFIGSAMARSNEEVTTQRSGVASLHQADANVPVA